MNPNDNKDKFEDAEESVDAIERYLQFDLGQENYGIELLSVKEVIPLPETTPLPNSPKYFIGIMNLRGQIISVVDLRKRLQITSKEEGIEEAVIIVECHGIGIGVIVDSINKVLNICPKEIKVVPEVSTQINSKYISGVYQAESKLTVILEIEKILNINDIKDIQQNKEAA